MLARQEASVATEYLRDLLLRFTAFARRLLPKIEPEEIDRSSYDDRPATIEEKARGTEAAREALRRRGDDEDVQGGAANLDS